MKRLFICMIAACLHFAMQAQEVEYTKEDSLKIVNILNNAGNATIEGSSMLYFGKLFLGIPYVAHTLENGDKEHLIVNLHELDCTTFVETVLALNMCFQNQQTTFKDYCDNLMKIRYREGKMTDYTSRLHYFTWWGEDNEKMGIVRQVVDLNPTSPFTAQQKINVDYMSKNPGLYKQLKNHPEFVEPIRKYEQMSNGKTFRYIPKSKLNLSRNSLGLYIQNGDIISIITNKQGLDTSHIGIAFWKGGRLHLMHASSLAKKVIMDDKTFYDYSMGQRAHLGIRVYRPIPQNK